MFHGEPTVGLQSNIPLSRRVQLAVLAHIRHTHTRYDKLLRETSWMNARKAVEPICLDVLVKWRGDEETGRDQMDEILREVVIITDSEGESDSSDEDSSDEEGEVTSVSSEEAFSLPPSRNQQRSVPPDDQPARSSGPSVSQIVDRDDDGAISSRTRARTDPKSQKDKKAQRGFKRYQAAWEDALNRHQERPASIPRLASTPFEDSAFRRTQAAVASPIHVISHYPQQSAATRPSHLNHQYVREDNVQVARKINMTREVSEIFA